MEEYLDATVEVWKEKSESVYDDLNEVAVEVKGIVKAGGRVTWRVTGVGLMWGRRAWDPAFNEDVGSRGRCKMTAEVTVPIDQVRDRGRAEVAVVRKGGFRVSSKVAHFEVIKVKVTVPEKPCPTDVQYESSRNRSGLCGS